MKKSKITFDLQEILSNTEEATEFNEITDRIIKEESEKLVDETKQKLDEAWSILANQVVGSENF